MSDETLTVTAAGPGLRYEAEMFQCPRAHTTSDAITKRGADGQIIWAACLLCIAEDHPATLVPRDPK